MYNFLKKRRLAGVQIKQAIVKVLLKNQSNDKILLLGKQNLKELEFKLQISVIQEKSSLIELKKNNEEFFIEMSHFVHKGWPLLLVLGSKNSLRVFSEDKLMKKLNLDFDVLNYSVLDVMQADLSYNQIVFGFNMMTEKEQKIYKDEMYSPFDTQNTNDFYQANDSTLPKKKSSVVDFKKSTIGIKETLPIKRSLAVKLICVKDNFLILTNDMRFCFCKLDKFEKKCDSIYNPLSILFPSNYQILTSKPNSILYSLSVNNKLSTLAFNLLIPTVPQELITEEVVSESWANKTGSISQAPSSLKRSRMTRTVDKSESRFKKGRKTQKGVEYNYRFKSYVLNILQLDTEKLPLKPLQPVNSTKKAVLDISIARSKNVVCYTDVSSTIRLFSINKQNEYKTALVHHPE
jgi:hypothetical protein